MSLGERVIYGQSQPDSSVRQELLISHLPFIFQGIQASPFCCQEFRDYGLQLRRSSFMH